MAFDMVSDTCVGLKRRTTEIGDTQETLPPPPSSSLPTSAQEDKPEQHTTENKNLGLLFESKKAKCSPHREASASIVEENQELGFASGAEQGQEMLVSGCEQVKKNKNCDVGSVSDGEVKREKFDFVEGGVEETVKESFLSGFMKSEMGFVGIQRLNSVGGDHEQGFNAFKENKGLGKKLESESYLEVRKKKNKIYVKKQTDFDRKGSDCQEVQNGAENVDVLKGINVRSSLKVEVIDETALIEFNNQYQERKSNKNVKQEMDGKKVRQPRRKAKKVLEMEMEANGRHKNVVLKGEDQNGSKKVYSRKDMEALRFANIPEQRKLWKDVYNGLGPAVVKEYDDLASGKNQKHIRFNFDPRHRFMKREEAPAIVGVVAARGRNHMNVFAH